MIKYAKVVVNAAFLFKVHSFPESLKNINKTTVNRTMSSFKYLIGIWTAVAVYTLLSFLGGSKSLSAYNFLLAERDRQRENLGRLEILNEDFERTKNNLLYDQDTQMVLARQAGFGREDEHFIRIVGLSNISSVPITAGTVYSAQSPDFIADRTIKIAALSIGIFVFAFFLMFEIIEKRSK